MHRIAHDSDKLLVVNPAQYTPCQLKDIFTQEFPRPPDQHFSLASAGDFIRFQGLTVLGLPNLKNYLCNPLKPPADILIVDQANLEDATANSTLEGALRYWSSSLIIVNEPLRAPAIGFHNIFSLQPTREASSYLVITRSPSKESLTVVQKQPDGSSISKICSLQSHPNEDLRQRGGQMIHYDFKRRSRLERTSQVLEMNLAIDFQSHVFHLLTFVKEWLQSLGEAFYIDDLNALDANLRNFRPELIEYFFLNYRENPLLVKALLVKLGLLPSGLLSDKEGRIIDEDVSKALEERGLTAMPYDEFEELKNVILRNYDMAARYYYRRQERCLSLDQKIKWSRAMNDCPLLFLHALGRLVERPVVLDHLLYSLGISHAELSKQFEPPSTIA